MDLDYDNDLNFDVNKDMRIHMKTDDNYRGRDVKFNVHLPHDLIDHAQHNQEYEELEPYPAMDPV